MDFPITLNTWLRFLKVRLRGQVVLKVRSVNLVIWDLKHQVSFSV